MNYFTTFLLVSVASLQFVYGIDPDYKKQIMAEKVKCQETSTLPEDTVMEVVNMKSKLETRDEKCFSGCLLKGIGIIKDDTYDWETHQTLIVKVFHDPNDQEKAKQVVHTCKGKVNVDNCQLAFDIQQCLKEEAVKIGLGPPKPRKQ